MTRLHASIRHDALPDEGQVPEPLRSHIQIDRAADSWRFRSDGDLGLEDTFRDWPSRFETVLTIGDAIDVRACLRILGRLSRNQGPLGALADAADRDGGAIIDETASLVAQIELALIDAQPRPVAALVDLRSGQRFAGWPQGHTIHRNAACTVLAGTDSLQLDIPGRNQAISVDGWQLVGDDTLSAHTPEGRQETLSGSIARTLTWLARGSSQVQVACGDLTAVFGPEMSALQTAFRVAEERQTGLRIYSRGPHLPDWWSKPPELL